MDAGGDAGADASDASHLDAAEASVADASDASVKETGTDATPDAVAEAGSSDAQADASVDAGDAGALCTAIPISSSIVTAVDVTDGATVPPSSYFTGGVIESGTYYMTAATHYGSQYGGPAQQIIVIDAVAMTMEMANAYPGDGGSFIYYYALPYTYPDSRTISGNAACNTGPFSITTVAEYYTFSGTGAGATITWNRVGSSDVEVYTKQ
jgi:hypothetical protein